MLSELTPGVSGGNTDRPLPQELLCANGMWVQFRPGGPAPAGHAPLSLFPYQPGAGQAGGRHCHRCNASYDTTGWRGLLHSRLLDSAHFSFWIGESCFPPKVRAVAGGHD